MCIRDSTYSAQVLCNLFPYELSNFHFPWLNHERHWLLNYFIMVAMGTWCIKVYRYILSFLAVLGKLKGKGYERMHLCEYISFVEGNESCLLCAPTLRHIHSINSYSLIYAFYLTHFISCGSLELHSTFLLHCFKRSGMFYFINFNKPKVRMLFGFPVRYLTSSDKPHQKLRCLLYTSRCV